ncbi:SDR family NAD(P)-dependent oxidoreductase [Tepidamorphus sp. 3E244]|uniref:SDR family NAD(P)-dependent oxidoreductase n=1 Tax=Tepidamorphus sp. 3E244 TaxID=3385498 RepID=UPI0038FD2726
MFRQNAFAGVDVAITGARRGIGAGVARAFLHLGARVCAHCGVDPAKDSDPLVAGLDAEDAARLTILDADLEDESDTARLAADISAAMPRVDVFIHNAGTMHGRVMTGEMTAAHFDKVNRLNAGSTVLLTSALLDNLADGASVIFTSSISARTGGSPGSSVYSASKAFVSTYARSLARELAPRGIRVNAVSPGTIDTDFHSRYSSAEKLAATARAIPLQRLGTVGDCTGTYLFLAAPALSGYVTGQVIEVNGGQFMG